MSIQQLLLGAGAKKKTYMDDVFSTYLWNGSGSNRSINNGINLSGEGGLAWIKSRSNAEHNWLFDTANGADWSLNSDRTNARYNSGATYMSSFNNNGFSLGTHDGVNDGSMTYSSWSFRKAPGFFDVVKYEGTGSVQTINHNLGCIPGCILIKRLDSSDNWNVYHRDMHASNPAGYYLQLNTNDSKGGASNRWNDTAPTATQFTVGTAPVVNADGDDFVAYLFAGGLPTSDQANCIGFNSSTDHLNIGSSSSTTADFNFGTGDLTLECWIKCESSQPANYPRLIAFGPFWGANQALLSWDNDYDANKITFRSYNYSTSAANELLASSTKGFAGDGQWHHIAVSRSGDTWRLFVDGILEDTATWTGSLTNADMYASVGNTNESNSDAYFNGFISNVRVVKGTAVYTSSFKVPHEPLKNITNTVLLCCDKSTSTSPSVTPLTVTEDNISENNFSPFEDPASYIFGDNEDQNVIKCGSYTGTSGTDPVYIGWEPQWLMIKAAGSTGDSHAHWHIYDNMRGVASDGADQHLNADNAEAEASSSQLIDFTSTGFIADANGGGASVNGVNGVDYIYVALRRTDGYVGKPRTATEAFAMDTGGSSSTIPNFDSGFPVDFTFYRKPAATMDWEVGARLLQGKYLYTNLTDAEGSWANMVFDSNTGWQNAGNHGSDFQSWMWRRHAGFDVVTWEGTDGNVFRSHNLNRTPEMIWFKNRDDTRSWRVYHKGLNGGTNPEDYAISLNASSAEGSNTSYMNGTAPTSTHFVAGNDGDTNGSGDSYIALLFSSISGVSKCGFYSGSGSTDKTVDLGFSPRLIIIKNAEAAGSWIVLDTLRGLGAGNDHEIYLQSSNAESDSINRVDLSGDSMVVKAGYSTTNSDGVNYIFYAHA